ncbi:MAG: SDR family oxidoreductase [Actinomycetota bacterium]|nr:SDR family oxidoreductase [Actinomycetota bacterium]
MGQLNGKVIVVVGGSAGMGLAVSKRCIDEGATVVIMARGQQRLDEVAASLGQTAVPVVCDVASADSVRAAFAEVDRRFGKVDALLNVAGVGRIAKIADATDDDIDFVLDVNLRGPILTTRSAVPLLRKAGGGDIVNVSSEIVGDYMPFMVLYGTSKGGLDTFSRMLNHELRADKIRVSNYVAGSIGGTDFGVNFTPEGVEAALPEWLDSGYMTRVAGPGMDPEWMADAMVFVLTRPKGQMIDYVHVRSFAPGSALDTAALG